MLSGGFWLLGADGFDGGNKDGDEFVGFGADAGEFGCGDDFFGVEEVEPVGGFVGFLEAFAQFGSELDVGAGAIGFAIICTDGSAGAEKLFAEGLGEGGLREY